MADPNIGATALGEFQLISMAPRRGHDIASACEQSLGIALPPPGKWRTANGLRLVCVTPDQWMALRDGSTLFDDLASALGRAATMIDLSASFVAVRVSGAGARDALTKFLPLDLHPRAMQPGDAAATVAAHLPIVMWQQDEAPTYDLLCPRSLASSFHRMLRLAGIAPLDAPSLQPQAPM